MTEGERIVAIRDISLKYVELAKQRLKLIEDIELYDERLLLKDHVYYNMKEEMKFLEEKMNSLDISLGLLVKDGDEETVKEYKVALKF